MTQQELIQTMETAPTKLGYKIRLQKEAGEGGPSEEKNIVCNYVEVEAAGVYNFYAYINGQHSIIYSVRISNVEDIEFTGIV